MATTPAIASARESKKEPKVKTVGDMLRAPAMLKRFQAFTPEILSAERLYKVAVLAVDKTPKLAKADPKELLRSMMGVTGLGLEINSPMQHAFLIPFEQGQKVIIQIIIGYQGMIELAYRSGKVKLVMADVATKREMEETGPDKRPYFEFMKGTESFLRHRYHPERDEDTDEPAYAWAMYENADGARDFVVLPWSKVVRVRNGSAGYRQAKGKGEESAAWKKNPWVAEMWEMAKKTAIRQLYKIMPKSTDMAKAMELDEASERGEDLGPMLDLDPGEWHTRGEPAQPEQEPDHGEETKPKTEPKTEPKKGGGKAKAKPDPPMEDRRSAQADDDGEAAAHDDGQESQDGSGAEAGEDAQEAGPEAEEGSPDGGTPDEGQERKPEQEGWDWESESI